MCYRCASCYRCGVLQVWSVTGVRVVTCVGWGIIGVECVIGVECYRCVTGVRVVRGVGWGVSGVECYMRVGCVTGAWCPWTS